MPIPKFGYPGAVRVCDVCQRALRSQAREWLGQLGGLKQQKKERDAGARGTAASGGRRRVSVI
jgi:hypothetical protein